jgi:hypothetical protein
MENIEQKKELAKSLYNVIRYGQITVDQTLEYLKIRKELVKEGIVLVENNNGIFFRNINRKDKINEQS